MNLNLSRFKKTKVTPHYTILRHPSGHTFKIIHNSLTPEHKAEIDALDLHDHPAKQLKPAPTMMADGGEAPPLDPDEVKKFEQGFLGKGKAVGGEVAPNSAPDGTTMNNLAGYCEGGDVKRMADGGDTSEVNDSIPYNPDSPLAKLTAAIEGKTTGELAGTKLGSVPNPTSPGPNILTDTTMPAQQDQVQELAPAPSQAAATEVQPTPAPMLSDNPASQAALTGDIGQITAGMGQEARAAQAEAKNNVDVANTLQGSIDTLRTQHEESQQKVNALYDNIMGEVAGGKIDPNHFLSSRDTGTKIQNAIGMVLSGIGSGLTGQQNMAAQFINNSIDRDIAAQASNINNQKSLLGFLDSHLNNLNASTAMAKGLMLAGYANQLEKNKQQAIAGFGGNNPGLAEATLNQHIGNLKLEAAQKLQQAGLFDTLNQMSRRSAPNPPGIDYNRLNLLQASGRMPQSDVDKATKEANDYEESEKQWKNIEQAYKDVQGTSNLAAHIPFTQAKANVDSAKADVIASFEKAMGRRIPTEQLEMMAPLFPTGSNTPQQTQIKMDRMHSLFNSNKPGTTTLDRYGVLNRPTGQASTPPGPSATIVGPNGQRMMVQNGRWVPVK